MKKNNQGKDKTVRNFEDTIKEQEDQLFGIQIFVEGISVFTQHSKETMEMTHYHYQEIMERGRDAISQAKKLLYKVKSGKKITTELEKFQFPPIHGPGLDEITQRATLLVNAYNKLLPNRPRSRPLSTEEHKKVRLEAIKYFDGDNFAY